LILDIIPILDFLVWFFLLAAYLAMRCLILSHAARVGLGM
jgi:hypothetical protein